MKDQELMQYTLSVLNSIRIYCETSSAGGYSKETLEVVNKELEPILEICYDAIKKVRGTNET